MVQFRFVSGKEAGLSKTYTVVSGNWCIVYDDSDTQNEFTASYGGDEFLLLVKKPLNALDYRVAMFFGPHHVSAASYTPPDKDTRVLENLEVIYRTLLHTFTKDAVRDKRLFDQLEGKVN